jgi:hypothetical protein
MVYHKHITLGFNACNMKVFGAGLGYPNGFGLIRKIIQRKINEKSTGNILKHIGGIYIVDNGTSLYIAAQSSLYRPKAGVHSRGL